MPGFVSDARDNVMIWFSIVVLPLCVVLSTARKVGLHEWYAVLAICMYVFLLPLLSCFILDRISEDWHYRFLFFHGCSVYILALLCIVATIVDVKILG